jgi:hypothetical protein
MDGALDRREGEAQGDEALEGAEGNGDNFQLAFFVARHMKTGRMRCSVSRSSCRDKVGLGIARKDSIGRRSSWIAIVAQFGATTNDAMLCLSQKAPANDSDPSHPFNHSTQKLFPDYCSSLHRVDPLRAGTKVHRIFDRDTQPEADSYPECESEELRAS